MELISILLPTFNRANLISNAINSLLSQTYNNLQIIVVDDGSTDNTREIIEQLNDARIDYYEIKHSGISKALNYGLQKAESNIVVRIDSDDYCDPERINVQYSFYNKFKGQYGIIGSNSYVIDQSQNIFLKVSNPETNKNIIDQLPRRCCLSHPTLLYKKDIILGVGGYNENLKIVQDWDLR